MDRNLKSIDSKERIKVEFMNCSDRKVDVQWINYEGKPVHYSTLKTRETYRVNSYATHPWIALDRDGGSCMKLNDGWHFVVAKQQCSVDSKRMYKVYVCGSDDQPTRWPLMPGLKSINSDRPIQFEFGNCSDRKVDLLWIDFNAKLVHYSTLKRHQTYKVNSYATHPWIVVDCETGSHMKLNGRRHFVVSENDRTGDMHKVYIISPDDASLRKVPNPELGLRSQHSNRPIHIEFINTSPWDIDVFWIDFEGRQVLTESLSRRNGQCPPRSKRISSYATYPFIAVDREFGYGMKLNGESHFVVSESEHGSGDDEYKVFIAPPAPPAYGDSAQ